MRRTSAALLLLAAGPELVAQDVESGLSSLRVANRVIPFEAAVAITVQSSPAVPAEWYDHEDHVRLRVVAIADARLPAEADVTVRTSRRALGEIAEHRHYRLKGSIGDAIDFAGATEFSFATGQAELLAATPPAAAARPQLDLAAAVGTQVEFGGRLWSRNGNWWMDAGEDVCLTDARGRRRTFPVHWHGHRITVRGRLERQLRLPLRGDSATMLVLQPVVLDARVTLVGNDEERGGETTEPNRFRQLHDRSPRLVHGVFELIAEAEPLRNVMGNETQGRLWATRNWPHLAAVLADGSDAARNELARRVLDESREPAMRALYAGVLAAHDDERGRRYLRDAMATVDPIDRDALYVLGAFHRWRGDTTCDVAWCEAVALRCLRDAAGDACTFADVPDLLARIGSPACVELLLRTHEAPPAASHFGWPLPHPRDMLCRALLALPPGTLSDDVLLRIVEATPAADRSRALCAALLERDRVEAVELFLHRITENFWDREFHERAGPRVLEAIEDRLPELQGDVRSEAERLLRLRAPNATALLIERLRSADTPLAELAQLCWDLRYLDHAGAATIAAQVLRDRVLAADSIVELDALHLQSMVRFIGGSDERDAVAAMISLLDAGRPAPAAAPEAATTFRLCVAGHLAEMTGRSFGPDAAAWRQWFENR